ncbi:Mortality factor 4-like protein 1 [Dirofilaria immitis]|nr:Mortality factor 4-like protein 1 [Dirofilaria immitis]
MPPKKENTAIKDAAKEVTKPSDTYELHAKVLCQHLDNLYYEAKIINVEHSVDGEPIYTVHYQGWNQRHDEKIKHSSTRSRFLEYTAANVERAKAEMRDAQARLAQNKRRNRKSNVLDEKRSGGADSRGVRRQISVEHQQVELPVLHLTKRKPGAQPESEPISDFIRKNEIKIDIPSVLKDILVDDHDMVNRQMYLPRLPARHTVAGIVRQYADYMGTCVEAKDTLTFEFGSDDTQLNSMVVTLVESSYGIQDYFNNSLGLQLLYKFERPQYADLLSQHKTKQAQFFYSDEGTKDTKKKRSSDVTDGDDSLTDDNDKFKPSEYYGFIHLLRLFVRFGHMLGLTNWSDRTIEAIVNQVHNFLKFLEVNRHKFFDIETDYEVAPPEYQRRVWSS